MLRPAFITMALKGLSDIPGWKINKPVVVFESDDWGSIRMSSRGTYERLTKQGLDLDSADAERYNRNDALASRQDLEYLFEVLSSVKDINGNPAVFTPVSIVANPDFEKIKDADFQEYHFEPFTETLKRNKGTENAFELWMEGIENRVFVPQLHGREHLNVTSWMNSLRMDEKQTTLAFQEGFWGFVPKSYPREDYQAAFLIDDLSELGYLKNVIHEAQKLFKDLFQYEAEFFVPPNGMFHNSLNQALAENKIKYRYVSRIQNEPLGKGKFRKKYHYLGQKEKNGIHYIIRNCFFEPSQVGKDWVDTCLKDIQVAFDKRKPAIIGTHRVNYIGSLNAANRDTGLKTLSELLRCILKRWPDATFLTTPQLGALMKSEN
ncbi:MAG: hypothetical protein P1P86_12700 [Bacteroidales bacterium]|nr:hypothetical protein [Bacteroidales bacterium]